MVALLATSAQAASWRGIWRATEAALVAGNAADAASSCGMYEMNPLLGRGPFGARQAALKFGVAGAVLVVEEIAARRAPGVVKPAAAMNAGAAAAFGVMAARNWRLK